MEVELTGRYPLTAAAGCLHFCCRLAINLATSEVTGGLTLHNPAAATHPEGLWDLGDPHAIDLRRVALRLEVPGRETTRLRPTPDAPWQDLPPVPLSLTQWSSGGSQRQSPVHKNRHGKVPLSDSGYTLVVGDDRQVDGARAQPVIQLCAESSTLSATIPDFWQRFPSAVATRDHCLLLELLPKAAPEPAELQPGERFTREFRLRIDPRAPDEPFTDVLAHIEPDYAAACGLAELGQPAAIEPRLQALAAGGLDAEGGFLSKREVIDEYGWRHFGELYADHENDQSPGQRIVSHYNNQYDPLFGFLRQHLLSGDAGWRELADDLARHVIDIDIYHTARDRPEYNHGLFWHTDHYLDAETATHRSYSRLHPQDAYEGHAGGGGPGGQHCYTTGLLYSYLLTGEPRYREALLGLRDWITRVYEGSGTLVDALLALKQRGRRDLKNHLTGRYPLDRGTANYLQALLDTHYLDRSPATLQRVEHIIRHTVHPGDNLARRELHKVEEHWFYVVFLQAVCRYLDVKCERQDWDDSFYYARDSLLRYADWMLAHEAPYLDRPDILEFPNHTWTAQDLRKATVLFSAARYDPGRHREYSARAGELVEHVASTLAAEPTRHYTRILALIMQNLMPSTAQPPLPGPASAARRNWGAPADPGVLAQAGNWLCLAGRALRHFRPRQEWQALVTRFTPFGVRPHQDLPPTGEQTAKERLR